MAIPLFAPSQGRPPPQISNHQRKSKSRKRANEQQHQQKPLPMSKRVCRQRFLLMTSPRPSLRHRQRPPAVVVSRQRLLPNRSFWLLILLDVFCRYWSISSAAAVHFRASAVFCNSLTFAVHTLGSVAYQFSIYPQVGARDENERENLSVEALLRVQERYGPSHLPPATFLNAGAAALPMHQHPHHRTQPQEHHDHDRHSSPAAPGDTMTKKARNPIEQAQKKTSFSQSEGNASLHNKQADVREKLLLSGTEKEATTVSKDSHVENFAAGHTAASISLLGKSLERLSGADASLAGTAKVAPAFTMKYLQTPQMSSLEGTASQTIPDPPSDQDAGGANNDAPALTAARLYAAVSIFICAIAGALPPLLILQRQQEACRNHGSRCMNINCSGSTCSIRGRAGDAISSSTARYIRLTMSFTGGVLLGVGLLHLLPSAERQISAARNTYYYYVAISEPALSSDTTHRRYRTSAVLPASSDDAIPTSSTLTSGSAYSTPTRSAASGRDIPADPASAIAAADAEDLKENRQHQIVQRVLSGGLTESSASHVSPSSRSLPTERQGPEQQQQPLLARNTSEQVLSQEHVQPKHISHVTTEGYLSSKVAGGTSAEGTPSIASPFSSLVDTLTLHHSHAANRLYARSAGANGKGDEGKEDVFMLSLHASSPDSSTSAAATSVRMDHEHRPAATAAGSTAASGISAATLPSITLSAGADAVYVLPAAVAMGATSQDNSARPAGDLGEGSSFNAFDASNEGEGNLVNRWRPSPPFSSFPHGEFPVFSSFLSAAPPPLSFSSGPGSSSQPAPQENKMPYPLAPLCCLFGVLLVMALEAVAEAEHAHHHAHSHVHARAPIITSTTEVRYDEQQLLQQQPQQQQREQQMLQHVIVVSSRESCTGSKEGGVSPAEAPFVTSQGPRIPNRETPGIVHPRRDLFLKGQAAIAAENTATAAEATAAEAGAVVVTGAGMCAAADVESVGKTRERTQEQQILCPRDAREKYGVIKTRRQQGLHLRQTLPELSAAECTQEPRQTYLSSQRGLPCNSIDGRTHGSITDRRSSDSRSGGRLVELKQQQQQHSSQTECASPLDKEAETQLKVTSTTEEKVEPKLSGSTAAAVGEATSAVDAAKGEASERLSPAHCVTPLCSAVACSTHVDSVTAAGTVERAPATAVNAEDEGGREGGGRTMKGKGEGNKNNSCTAAEEPLQQQQGHQTERASSSPSFASTPTTHVHVLLNRVQPLRTRLAPGSASSNGRRRSSSSSRVSGRNKSGTSSVAVSSEKKDVAEKYINEDNTRYDTTSMQRRLLLRQKVPYVSSCSAGEILTCRSPMQTGGAVTATYTQESRSSTSLSAIGTRTAAVGDEKEVGVVSVCNGRVLSPRTARVAARETVGQGIAQAPPEEHVERKRDFCSRRETYIQCRRTREGCCSMLRNEVSPLIRSGYASGCAFTAAAELCAMSVESPCCCTYKSSEKQVLSSTNRNCHSSCSRSHSCIHSNGSRCVCSTSSCLSSSDICNSGGYLERQQHAIVSPERHNVPASAVCAAREQSSRGPTSSYVHRAADSSAALPTDRNHSMGPAASGTPHSASILTMSKQGALSNTGGTQSHPGGVFCMSEPQQHLHHVPIARSSSDPTNNSSNSNSSGNRVSSFVNGLCDALLLRGRGWRSVSADCMYDNYSSASTLDEKHTYKAQGAAEAEAPGTLAASRIKRETCGVNSSHAGGVLEASTKECGDQEGRAASSPLKRFFMTSGSTCKRSSSRTSSRTRNGGNNNARRNIRTNKTQPWRFWKRTNTFTSSSSSPLCFPLLAASHSCCSNNACSRTSGPCDSCSSGPDCCGPRCSAGGGSSFQRSYSNCPTESIHFRGRDAVSAASVAIPSNSILSETTHGDGAVGPTQRPAPCQHSTVPLVTLTGQEQQWHKSEVYQQQRFTTEKLQQQQRYVLVSKGLMATGDQYEGLQMREKGRHQLSRCTYTGSSCCHSTLCVSRSRSRLSGCGRCSSNEEGNLLPPYGTSSSSASFLADEIDTQDREGGGGSAKSMLVSSVLMLALSFHSLMEGVTLGTTLRPHVVAFAVLIHKGLESFALGSSLLQTQTRLRTFLWQMGLFALMTPAGVLLGLSITLWTQPQQQYQASSHLRQQVHSMQEPVHPALQHPRHPLPAPFDIPPFSSFISWYLAVAAAARAAAQAALPLLPGILTGIGSGTFLHVSLLECVAPQLMRSRAEGKASLLAVIAAVGLGAVIMSLLA